jgi:glycosyltransferase involved in cell wall biosynthesis
MLRELERHYGPLRSSHVLPNARAPGRFHAACKEPMILTAGRLWDEAKNLALLAAAAREVHWPVVAAGATRLAAVPAAGSVAGIESVQSLGPLPADVLADWYARAAIYALPARYEPFGLTVLEAALSGCALVLGDIGSLREVWGAAALYVSPDDRIALRDTLNELAADPALREDLARLARERARDYSPGRLAASHRSLYRQLTHRTRPEPERSQEHYA